MGSRHRQRECIASTESSWSPSGVEGFSAQRLGRRGHGRKGPPRSCSTRRWAPRPRCSAGGPTSSSPRADHSGLELWRTGSTTCLNTSCPRSEDPEWNNSTVLRRTSQDEVSKLKEETDGEIVVAGSIRLVRTLMENDLVDELRLMIYPVVLGAGKRLFGKLPDRKAAQLVETQPSTTLPRSPTRSSETPRGTANRPSYLQSYRGIRVVLSTRRRLSASHGKERFRTGRSLLALSRSEDLRASGPARLPMLVRSDCGIQEG